MNGQPALDDRPLKTSPWPLLVALGLAVSELGVLFGLLFVSVAGILLFGGSCAGIIAESGYATSPWGPLAGIGGLFALLGSGLWAIGAMPVGSVEAVARAPLVDGVAFRGAAVLATGALLIVVGTLGTRLSTARSSW